LALSKMANGLITVDTEAAAVYFRGQPIHNTAVDHMIAMMRDGFDVEPMSNFLGNLYQNPNPKTIQAVYGWMQANNVTITEDGCLIAYKRVRSDYLSFYDGATKHAIGQVTSIAREQCDQANENTCSSGLHFCSHAYLPHYYNGEGRVLILKINPAHITAIPTDYNFAKGRTCSYEVIGELDGEARQLIEREAVITTPVMTEQTNASATQAFKTGYQAGYKDGRGKQAFGKSVNADLWADSEEYKQGYREGRDDGRKKLPKKYGDGTGTPDIQLGTAPAANNIIPTPLLDRARFITSDMMGVPVSQINEATAFVADLGADSLDLVELVMYFEDDFGIEISDEDAERCVTVGDVCQMLLSRGIGG